MHQAAVVVGKTHAIYLGVFVLVKLTFHTCKTQTTLFSFSFVRFSFAWRDNNITGVQGGGGGGGGEGITVACYVNFHNVLTVFHYLLNYEYEVSLRTVQNYHQ